MSSHRLDAAGARQLQITLNDPAATIAWMPAKAGEDVEASFNGREIRLLLPRTARFQRRRVTTQKPVYENSGTGTMKQKEVDGVLVYEEHVEDRLVLVLSGSSSVFVRCSDSLFADDDPAKPTHEQHPMSSIFVRRRKDEHYTEEGVLITEVEASAFDRVLDEAIDGPLVD